MFYGKVECPHCGNEITVNNEREIQKCCWCRRVLSVKFERFGKKKSRFNIKPMEFTEEEKKSYNKWKEEDTYGSN
jgi:ribosomal protein S27E